MLLTIEVPDRKNRLDAEEPVEGSWRDELKSPTQRLVGVNKNFINHGAIRRLAKRYNGGGVIDGVWGLYFYARKIGSRSFKLKSRYEGLKILQWPRHRYGEFDRVLEAIQRRTLVVKKWYTPGEVGWEKRKVKIGRVRRGKDKSVRVTFTDEFWAANDIEENGGYIALAPLVGMAKLKTVAEKLLLLHVCAFSSPNWKIETWMNKIGLKYEYPKRAVAKIEELLMKVNPVYAPSGGDKLKLVMKVEGDKLWIGKYRRGMDTNFQSLDAPVVSYSDLLAEIKRRDWTAD